MLIFISIGYFAGGTITGFVVYEETAILKSS